MHKKTKEQIKLEDMIEFAELRIELQETIEEHLKNIIDNIKHSEINDDDYMKLYYDIKNIQENIVTNYIYLTGLKDALSIFEQQCTDIGERDVFSQSHLYQSIYMYSNIEIINVCKIRYMDIRNLVENKTLYLTEFYFENRHPIKRQKKLKKLLTYCLIFGIIYLRSDGDEQNK